MRETPSFEQLYVQERKKTRVIAWVGGIMALAIIIAVVLFMQKGGGVALAPVTTGSTTPQTLGNGSSSGGGIKVADNAIQGFLNADGSVNKSKIDQILGQVPPAYKDQMLERFEGMIDQATTTGEITSTQASELRKAFGL